MTDPLAADPPRDADFPAVTRPEVRARYVEVFQGEDHVFATDHSLSDHRVMLARTILGFQAQGR